MTAIVDYGVGNLFSLKSSLSFLGEETAVTSDSAVLMEADRLVLPGVGAFADAAKKLHDSGLDKTVLRAVEAGKPLLGICLGMQLLFTRSLEYGEHSGLNLIPGVVRPISDVIPDGLKIPHIGWNALHFRNPTPVFKSISDGDFVYFVHSYYADCDNFVTAVTDYGAPLTASVQRDNVYGCQFHPEKSGKTGLAILRSFCEM